LDLLVADNLTYDLNVSYHGLSNAAKLIRQCPNNTFVLDHMGNPDIKTGEMEIWKAGIKEISELPNVFCKVSGIITKSGKDWTTSLLEPYFMQVVESFGVERLMYGGDWPVVLLAGSYLSWSLAFEELTEGFSNNELLQIFNKNADRIYQL
jgi:L-fuconolactonase